MEFGDDMARHWLWGKEGRNPDWPSHSFDEGMLAIHRREDSHYLGRGERLLAAILCLLQWKSLSMTALWFLGEMQPTKRM
jgi:hypothetical protein